LKRERWGSPLVQEKYREEMPVTRDYDDDDDHDDHDDDVDNNNNNNNLYRNLFS